MTVTALRQRPRRTPSPALLRTQAALGLTDAQIRRRIGWAWGLLFLNVLPYLNKSVLVPMPLTAGKVVTQSALFAALVLALSVNRHVLVRPNLLLVLMTVLTLTTLMMSLRGYFGLGGIERAVRLVVFVAVLWLLTPWWGRDDLLFLHLLRRALGVILVVVAVGAVIFPGHAFTVEGAIRINGVIWPMPATTVAHFAAILAGTTVIMWFSSLISTRTAALVTSSSLVMLLLTHTRTAVVGLLLGILVGGISLFCSRKRVRKVVAIALVVGGLLAVSFTPLVRSWFLRGETANQLSTLTGRTTVWTEIEAQPRSTLNTVFGGGMSNDSFNGLPIDSSWFSTYVDQGLFGDVVDGAMLLALFLIALLSPRGPRRAIALFLVAYCLVASFTETGLGEATPYMLDLAVAASVLMAPLQRPALPFNGGATAT